MQKLRDNIPGVIKGMIDVGMGIQIVLGILWMLGNMTVFHNYPDSYLYLKISESLVCDEYEGILYPLMVRLFRGAEDLVGIPYYVFLYGIQLGMAFAAAYCFLDTSWQQTTARKIWASLGLVTFPLAMQCHLAVLPESLLSSLILMEFAVTIKEMRKTENSGMENVWMMAGLWGMEALLLPEYAVFGAIPLLICFILKVRILLKQKHGFVQWIAVVLLMAGVIILANSVTQTPGAYEKTHNSFEWMAVKRTVLSRAEKNYG